MTETQTVTAPATTTLPARTATVPATTETPGTAADLEAVKAPVAGYLEAKIKRDLNQALPYLTPAFTATLNQGTFAGTSNPHVGRYEILGGPTASAGGSYTVIARVYQEYTGQGEIGYSDDTFTVVPSGGPGGQYLVSGIKAGSFISLQ